MTKRKRGAPKGNRNALKHGLYSAAFKEQERRLLARLPVADLSAEIDLIRVANYRLLQALNQSSAPLDVDAQLSIVRAVNLSTRSITSLLRAQGLLALTTDGSPLFEFARSLLASQSSPEPSPHDNAALHAEGGTEHQPPGNTTSETPNSEV